MIRLTAYELAVVSDGSVARLLDLEERYGSQRAALDAHPELALVARATQMIRAKLAADQLGLQLRGDGVPFGAAALATIERVLGYVVHEVDREPLVSVSSTTRSARLRDDDPLDDPA